MNYVSLILTYLGLGVFVTAALLLIPYLSEPVFGSPRYNRYDLGMVVLGAILMAVGFAARG